MEIIEKIVVYYKLKKAKELYDKGQMELSFNKSNEKIILSNRGKKIFNKENRSLT